MTHPGTRDDEQWAKDREAAIREAFNTGGFVHITRDLPKETQAPAPEERRASTLDRSLCRLLGHRFIRTDVRSDDEFLYYNVRCHRCGAKG